MGTFENSETRNLQEGLEKYEDGEKFRIHPYWLLSNCWLFARSKLGCLVAGAISATAFLGSDSWSDPDYNYNMAISGAG